MVARTFVFYCGGPFTALVPYHGSWTSVIHQISDLLELWADPNYSPHMHKVYPPRPSNAPFLFHRNLRFY